MNIKRSIAAIGLSLVAGTAQATDALILSLSLDKYLVTQVMNLWTCVFLSSTRPGPYWAMKRARLRDKALSNVLEAAKAKHIDGKELETVLIFYEGAGFGAATSKINGLSHATGLEYAEAEKALWDSTDCEEKVE